MSGNSLAWEPLRIVRGRAEATEGPAGWPLNRRDLGFHIQSTAAGRRLRSDRRSAQSDASPQETLSQADSHYRSSGTFPKQLNARS